MRFESSVNSYDSQTVYEFPTFEFMFESSVNSYDSQTPFCATTLYLPFESSVNSYDSQTNSFLISPEVCLRVV